MFIQYFMLSHHTKEEQGLNSTANNILMAGHTPGHTTADTIRGYWTLL